jgi:hypothetical protein
MTTTDPIIQTFWEDVEPGTKVRWSTPNATHYGVVISRDDQSLILDLWDQDKPKVLPDGLWYFAQGKINPNAEEHLVILSEFPKNFGQESGKLKPRHDEAEWITVQDAIAVIPMDPKQLRRHLRNGVFQAKRKEDRWFIDRESFMSVCAKRGWL